MENSYNETWKNNLYTEVHYWRRIISGTYTNKEWVEAFKKRAPGIDYAFPWLHKYLLPGKRILDVGSGPASVLGSSLNGYALDVTAVDPLAEEYEKLYAEYNIWPTVKVVKGTGEDLQDVVSGKFDFVYSRNALDHSYNPLKAMINMFNVCNDGGFVFIENSINEGLKGNYGGLHQWNFMPADNDLVIWNKDNTAFILSHHLPRNTYKRLEVMATFKDWLNVVITK